MMKGGLENPLDCARGTGLCTAAGDAGSPYRDARGPVGLPVGRDAEGGGV